MADKFHSLSLADVTMLTNILAPDILESPAFINADIFERLRIKVLSGTEFQRTQMIFRRKGGAARQYKEGSLSKQALGYMEQRKLEVTLSAALYQENLQNFREKEPFSILGSNGTYNAPVSEFIIRNVGKQYAGDVLNNIAFGKKSLGTESPMGLYDGIWTLADNEIAAGKISKALMNYVEIQPFTDSSSNAASENYEEFVRFVESWHPALRNAEQVVVYCSPETKRRIVTSYMKTFTGFQSPSAGTNSFRFFDMPNIELVSHAAFGRGSRLLATVPENIEFGLDTLNDMARVSVSHEPTDQNILYFQVQSAQGMRILDTAGPKFCVSNQVNTQIEELNGDYQKNSVTVSSNDKTLGTVSIDNEKPEYALGESLSMTATPTSTGQFVKWSDGATVNPRTIVFSGSPETYQAIFEAKGS